MKCLTDAERIERIKEYRSMIHGWKVTHSMGGPDSLLDDVHDLEAWVNVMNGPSDGDRGRSRGCAQKNSRAQAG